MNPLSRQKKEIQEDKDKIINHIQAKLAELRQQRKRLEDPSYQVNQQQSSQPINPQSKALSNAKQSILKQIPSNNINIPAKKQPKPPLSSQQLFYHKHHQQQVKQNLKNLQDLYNKKKQLQAVGIIPASMNQVDALYNDPKTKKKLAQYDPKAKQLKDKVLKQEMQRIELLLKKKKVNKKQIHDMKQHYYANLMKEKQQKLQRYEELLIYNKRGLKLSLLQKEQLIDIVFETLREFTGSLRKQLARDFLLANEKFCEVFYITQEEIFNDLQVYQTQKANEMTRNQFYQFVKSVEISNPMLNPNMRLQKLAHNKKSTTSSINASRVSKTSTTKSRTEQNQAKLKSQTVDYFKKLFQYFDQSKEGLIEREKFVIALSKGLLLDAKKHQLVKKQYLEKFANYLEKLRQNKNQKSYYMKLEAKFLGWAEIDQFYSIFVKGVGIENDQNKVSKQDDTTSNLQPQDNYSEFAQQKPQASTPPPAYQQQQPLHKGSLQQYFQQYGWTQQPTKHQAPYESQLKKFDSYYKTLRQQYGNEIQWNNNIRDKLSLENNQEFREDFKKLEMYIRSYEKDGE